MFELVEILRKLDSQEIEKDIIVKCDNQEFGIGGFYIMDETFYIEMVEKNQGLNSDNFLFTIEREAEDEECWQDDIYRSAMERIADCDAMLINEDDLENDRFENSLKFKIEEKEDCLILEV